jgi:hypothetical protein
MHATVARIGRKVYSAQLWLCRMRICTACWDVNQKTIAPEKSSHLHLGRVTALFQNSRGPVSWLATSESAHIKVRLQLHACLRMNSDIRIICECACRFELISTTPVLVGETHHERLATIAKHYFGHQVRPNVVCHRNKDYEDEAIAV